MSIVPPISTSPQGDDRYTFIGTYNCNGLVIFNPQRACAVRVMLLGQSVCLCVSVKSHPASGASVRPENSVMYSMGNEGPKNCGGYCSDIPHTFSMAEPSKGPKKANNRLNSTWNTTRCKVGSFFLFSLCLLPKVFRILLVNLIRDLACGLSRIHIH